MDNFNPNKKITDLENEVLDQYTQTDEMYDDNYDDEYYDERLEYIIDEIEDIKDSLNSLKKAKEDRSTNAEIEKLRADLEKTQNAQSLYFEIEKVKNEMSKENKAKEEQLNSEIASLRRSLRGSDTEGSVIATSAIVEEISKINDRLDKLSGAAATVGAATVDEALTQKIDALTLDISAIKEQLLGIEFSTVDTDSVAAEVEDTDSVDLAADIASLKELLLNEIESLKSKFSEKDVETVDDAQEAQPVNVSDDQILNEIQSLREEISAFKTEMNIGDGSYQASNNVDILNEILLLREDLSNSQNAPKEVVEGEAQDAINVDDLVYEQDQLDRHSVVLGELNKIKESFNDVALIRQEVQALKTDLESKITLSSGTETDNTAVYALAGLIASLKEEITELKAELAVKEAPAVDNSAIIELRDLALSLKAEVSSLKREMIVHFEKDSDTSAEDSLIILDELSVIQKDIKSIKDEPDATVLSEVLQLRESFQNMKEDLKLVDNTSQIMGGINMLKEAVNVSATTDQVNNIFNEISGVRQDVAALANGGAVNEKVLSEISALKVELAANQEADKASMMFINELTQSKLLAEKEGTATVDNQSATITELRNELAELATLITHKDDSTEKRTAKAKKSDDGTITE